MTTDSQFAEEALGKTHDGRLLIRLLQYLRPYKGRALAALAVTALAAPLVTAGPLLTRVAIDVFLAPFPAAAPSGFSLFLRQSAAMAGFGGSREAGILFIALVYLLANTAGYAVQFAQWMIVGALGQNIMCDLRQDIFNHLQKLPIRFYDRNPVGRLMTRLTSDVDSLNELFNSGVIVVFGNIVMSLYVMFWMFYISWPLALVSFAAVLLMIVFVIWFRVGSRSASRAVRLRMAEIYSFLQEHLAGMQIVQIFTREMKEAKAFQRINRHHWQAAMSTTLRNAIFYPLLEIMASAGIALIVWYGGGRAIRGAVSLGALVAFIQLARAFYDPILELSNKYNILHSAMASAERIFKLLDEPMLDDVAERRLSPGSTPGRLEFRNVWFAYHAEDWVLKDVSFVVEPGEKVAFVGHTGAGKTTITSLLLRLYDTQRGQILLDGTDICQIDPAELRSVFGIVPQDIFLFSGDIASNIGLGDPRITASQIIAAAREVRMDEFIATLEKGYHTELFERGAGLSTGQKQLIGFARALAFDRSILILDEATSSIDTETESLIRDAVKRLMAGRTSLVIAHRLSTIQAVDKIIVMHKGEIREMGDHQSLLARRGLYWRLYQLQFCRNSMPAALEVPGGSRTVNLGAEVMEY